MAERAPGRHRQTASAWHAGRGDGRTGGGGGVTFIQPQQQEHVIVVIITLPS